MLAALTVIVTDPFTASVEEDKVAVMPDGVPNGYMLMAEPAEGQVSATVVVPPGATVMVEGVNTILQLAVHIHSQIHGCRLNERSACGRDVKAIKSAVG